VIDGWSASNERVVAATKKWIVSFVVAYDFCPFAGREVERNSIRYRVLRDPEPETCVGVLLEELQAMDADRGIETTLLILARGYEDFEEYLRIAVTDHDRLLAYDVARYRLYAAVSALVVAAIVAIGIAVELLHFRTGYHPWALFLPLAGVPAYNYVQLRRSQGRLLGDRVADGADGAW